MNNILIQYTDTELRNLVEEFITQQKSEFSIKGVCSYILYWAVEDEKVAEAKTLIESNVLSNDDQDRVKQVLGAVVADGRIAESTSKTYIKR